MKSKTGKFSFIIRVVLATLVFSLFLRLDSIFSVVDSFVDLGWSLAAIFVTITAVRLILGSIVVLLIMPPILQFGWVQTWLPGFLRTDKKNVLLGVLSFVIFMVLAVALSLAMGIFKGDLGIVFAMPDIDPDPDVVGWGFFLLALVPGIWEELAFRGLIQSQARKLFSVPMTVLFSALFFGLYHFSILVTEDIGQVIPKVIMAFFFGIAYGYMAIKARSVVPAIISHYLVDSMGNIFIGVDTADPALATIFYLVLTLLFPLVNVLLIRWMYREARPTPYEGPAAAGV